MSQDNNKNGGRSNRDRSVPPSENYYRKTPPDLNFNSRNSDFVVRDNQKRNSYNPYEEDGFNPTDYDYISPPERSRSREQSNRPQNRNASGNRNSSSNDRNRSQNRPENRSNGTSPRNNKGKKKKKKKLSVFKIIIIIILLLVLLIPALAVPVLNKINYDEQAENQYVSASDLKSDSGVMNVLLLGVDARADDDDESSRSDSMMLVSLDKNHHCVKLTSFLRDSWVYIPAKGSSQRLNAACTYGGYQGVVDTIEYNFGVDIDGYVVTDFEMFQVMVDSLGGVDVSVTEKEADEVTSHKGRYGDVVLDAGDNQTLTGKQALAYCRIRKIDSDWKRTERQRTVMMAIMSKTLKSGPVKAYKMANNCAPYIETSLTKGQLVKFMGKATSCVTGGFEQESCPFDGTWEYTRVGGASVIGVDADKNKELLINYIYNMSKEDIEKSQSEKDE